MRKKTIFVIPGFRHTPKQKAYKTIAKMLRKQGFCPIVVPISWRDTTISENTVSFLKQYKKVRREEKYILGFSFGAMIALLAATKVKTHGLILCSLSPYFQEDKIIWNPTLGTKRYEDFSKLAATRLARSVKAGKTLFLYGEKEATPLINRVYETYALIPSTKKYLLPLQKTDHDITALPYLSGIYHATSYLTKN
jgi:esterase/lipase